MKKQLFTFLALLITGIVSAQVGIGTTTPTQALDIETNEAGGTAIDINNTGTGDPKINLQLNGTTTFSIGVDNDDADKLKIGTTAPETNTRVTIDATGNVGIGTSEPEKGKLQVNNSIALLDPSWKSSDNDDQLAGKIEFYLGGNSSELNTPVAAIEGYDKYIGTSFKGALAFKVYNTERMRINEEGNVGIGTTTPNALLTVNGNIYMSASSTEARSLEIGNGRTGNGNSYIDFIGDATYTDYGLRIIRNNNGANSDANILNRGTGILAITAYDAGSIDLKTTNTARLSITSEGLVGIGTSSPSEKLDIVSSDATKTAVDINNTGGGDPKINLQVGGTTKFSIGVDNDDADKLKIGTSALETDTRLTIDASGNVGIGTTTPNALLTVNGNIDMPASSTEVRRLEIGNGRTGDGFSYIDLISDATYTDFGLRILRNGGENADAIIRNRGTGVLYLIADDAGGITLKTNGAARFIVTSDGLIGIGRAPTTNALEVNGTASKTTAGDWLANSDARLKKDIHPIDSKEILNKMLQLKGITYLWNDTVTGNNRPTEVQYGFTAQNIQEVFPLLVQKDSLGYLQTAYGTYDAMYVESIRALQQQIDDQQAIIEAQKKEIDSQKAEASNSSAETNQKLDSNTSEIEALKAQVQQLLQLIQQQESVSVVK